MYELIDKISLNLPVYLLVFSRMSAMIATLPIIGYAVVSVKIRIALSILLTLIVSPLLISGFHTTYTTFLPFVVAIMGEVFTGMLIGYGARLVFEAFSVAGAFVGYQMGMAIMNVFDPSTQNQQPIIGNFWLLIIVIFFLVTNGHYFLIETLFQNFQLIHLGGETFRPEIGRTFVNGGRIIYDMALRFAAPTMVFLLVTDVAIAFMARVMPQLNIFFISLPLKIGAGIFLLIFSLQIFQSLFGYVNDQMQTFVTTIVRSL